MGKIEKRLRAVGHQVEQVLLPYLDDRSAAPGQLMAFRLMAVSHGCDTLIALGAPAHVLVHPCKIVWCCNEPRSLLSETASGSPAWLRASNALGFGEAAAVYASSPVRQRHLRDAGIPAGLLHVPEEGAAPEELDPLLNELLAPARPLTAAAV